MSCNRVAPWLLLAGILLSEALAAQPDKARVVKAPPAPSVPVAAPASGPQPAPEREDKWPSRLVLAVAVSGAAAVLRVFQRFRRFSGLGLFRNWYTWSFVVFAAVLAGAAYTGLAEMLSALGLLSATVKGGSMAVPQVAGASGLGHGLLALGRLWRPRKKPPVPGDDPAEGDAPAVNQLLDFFYTGIRIHVQERMHLRAKELARRFDFATIRRVTCELLENEIDTKALSALEGEKTVKKIRALSPARSSAEELSYDALRWTIVRASYSQLNSRLARETK